MTYGERSPESFERYVETYLDELLRDAYPCVPAMQAYKEKKISWHAHTVQETSALCEELLAQFHKFHTELPSREPARVSNIAFISERPGYTAEDYQKLFWEILSSLRELDDTPWPEGLTTDINNPSFQYCLFGAPYFPAGFWYGHPHRSRSTPLPIGMMIVFSSPDNVLYLKNDTDKEGGEGRFHRLVETIRERDIIYSGASLAVSQFFGTDGSQAQHSQIWEYQGIGQTVESPTLPLDIHA